MSVLPAALPALLAALIAALRQHWQSQGIGPGQRVALVGLSGPEFALAFWSLWQVGAITRPLNPRFPSARLNESLQDCDFCLSPTSLASPPHWLDRAVFQRQLAKTLADPLPHVLVLPRPELLSEQPLTEILTSGSSVQPKAVLHTWGNHQASAEGSLVHLPLQPGDTWLAALPLFHIGGLAILIRTALAGASVAFPQPDMPLEAALTQFQPSHLSLVPTQLHRLLQRPAPETLAQLQGCKAILLGGSAIPMALIDKALALELPIHTSYGSTEMGSQICTTRPGAALAELQTAGPVLPGREVRIAADGEIWVRGATRFAGYANINGLDTPFDAKGWFATGDLGQFTPQGWLQVAGRRDQRFISGGENIQPEAIEAALLRHPDILQAVVVPVPDLEFGQRPVAFLEAAQPVSLAEMRRFLSADLPGFMLPKALLEWPQSQDTGWKPSRQNLQILAEQRFRTI